MKTGFKILLGLVVILILDAICTIIIYTTFPTWNVFIVFGVLFIVITIIGVCVLSYYS